MGSMGDLVGRRLDHPLIGPVFVSWCVWNWPAVVWFLGAVAEPAMAYSGITTHLQGASVWRLLLFPAASGLLYAFGAPYLHLVYLKFDDFLRDRRVYQEAVIKDEAPIFASDYRQALERTEKLVAHCDAVTASFKDYSEAVELYLAASRVQYESLGVFAAPNLQIALKKYEGTNVPMVEAINNLSSFRRENMNPKD